MEYRPGDHAYVVTYGQEIRKVEIIRPSSRTLVRLEGEPNPLQVRKSKLHPTLEDAKASIRPVARRTVPAEFR